MFFPISAIILAKAYICIRDFEVLRASIASPPILKSKLSVKLLLSLDKKDTIIILKAKNNNKVLPLGPKKMPLLDNLLSVNTLVTYKKPWFWSSYSHYTNFKAIAREW